MNTDGGTIVTGQWDFEWCDLSATIGYPLEFFGGGAGQTAAGTRFGTTTGFGIPDIGGVPAKVMFVPGDQNNQIGYIMRHGIGPNGGGTRVNQYTLIMDLYWPPDDLSAFASFINMDLSNTSDGDFFFRVIDGGFGQGAGGYEGDAVMHLGQWHRVAFAVDMGASPPVVTKYLDGVKHADQLAPNNILDGARRSMPVDGAVLFADGDNGERRSCYVNSIQIRSGKLSDDELTALGPATSEGIPILIGPPPGPAIPRLNFRRIGDDVELSWSSALIGYVLESTPDLTNPSWAPVDGVTWNCVKLPPPDTMRFYRLRR